LNFHGEIQLQFKSIIHIRLKPGHSDPEGETAAQSLRDLRYAVQEVHVVKSYEVIFTAQSIHQAHQHIEEMCKRLFANPIKDDYAFVVEEMG
jgi:phosphoribosylformylglycinamidine synthase PurS subunit